jgi:hypothetical protein
MIPAGYQVSWKNGEKKRAAISKNVMQNNALLGYL